MAYYSQPYGQASPPLNGGEGAWRPNLPPVPPQLLSPKPQHPAGSPNLGGSRPALPPVPGNYLAQAAEEQRHSWYGPGQGYGQGGGGSPPVVSPKPQRAETVIPAESLQSQAEGYAASSGVTAHAGGAGGAPQLQLNFDGAPVSPSTVSGTSTNSISSFYYRPESAASAPPSMPVASPPPMNGLQDGYQSFGGPSSYLAPQLGRRTFSDQGSPLPYPNDPNRISFPQPSTGDGHPLSNHYATAPPKPAPPLKPHPPVDEFGKSTSPHSSGAPFATYSHPPIAPGYGGPQPPHHYPQAPPRPQTAAPLVQGMHDLRLGGPGPSDAGGHHRHTIYGADPNNSSAPFAPAPFTPPGQTNPTFAAQQQPNRFSAQNLPSPPSISAPQLNTSTSSSSGPKQLTAEPVPDMASLTSSFDSIFGPSASSAPAASLVAPPTLSSLSPTDLSKRIRWARQTLRYVERIQSDLASAGGSTRISDPKLVRFVDVSLKLILASAEAPIGDAEALYLRADLASTGAFPAYKVKDTTSAFRDFEASANKGHKPSWFRIGREYEAFQEWNRAVSAHERGSSMGDCAATYRLGMGYLLGQLALPVDLVKATAYLRSAADLADIDTPQPAYIFGMLLAGEFESLPNIPSDILRPNIADARARIERAAYLGFAAAQYKMGWLHEYAQMGCSADPLLSVEYYSLASKQGEVEADLALSKWFLCGSEPHFPRNETAAMEFAEKAAHKGLPSAMFAVGYYLEVGIGTAASGRGEPDLAGAERWYTKAVEAGNRDAEQRLQALRSGQSSMSRREFEQQVDSELVRKRTMEVQRNQPSHRLQQQPPMPALGAGPAGDLRRNQTMRRVEEARKAAQMTVAESKAAARKQRLPQKGAGQGRRPSEAIPPVPPVPSTPPSGTSFTGSGHSPQRPPPQAAAVGASAPHIQPHRLSDARPPQNAPTPQQRPSAGANRPMSTASSASTSTTGPSISTTGGNPAPTTFTSFEAMGIPTTKAKKDSDCVIM